MAACVVTVRVRIAWWFLWLYLPLLKAAVLCMGLPPDEKKLERWISRAVKTKLA